MVFPPASWWRSPARGRPFSPTLLPVPRLLTFGHFSGAGKTQLLLTLLLSAQLPAPHGLGRPTLYLTTEHALPTSRLHQLLRTNPVLKSHAHPPSLARIFTLSTTDLESQEHVLEYQLPVAIQRHNIGLLVVDSIAANFRAESAPATARPGTSSGGSLASRRAASLLRAGAALRSVARRFDCAVVVANQVADLIPKAGASAGDTIGLPLRGTKRRGDDANVTEHAAKRSRTASPSAKSLLNGAEPSSSAVTRDSPGPALPDRALSHDHQLRFFSGWGDDRRLQPIAGRGGELKTPALGLTWANQIAGRVALSREAAWAGPSRWRPPAGLAVGKMVRSDPARAVNGEMSHGRSTQAEVGHIEVSTADGGAVGDEGDAEWTPRRWRRWAKVVFASWTAPVGEGGRGVEFEVWEGGVRGVTS